MLFENLEIGMSASYSKKINEADTQEFANISGDKNPIHLNEEYAKNSRYKRKIAHGFMVSSLFSAIFGTKLPGEGSIYVSQTLQFKRAVYIGDSVIATVEIVRIDKVKDESFLKQYVKSKAK